MTRLFVIVSAAAAALSVAVLANIADAEKGGKGGGKGGGGGDLANPAFVIMDGDGISRLKLLSYDGLEEQEVRKAKAFQGMQAPTWSPDAQWIAYRKGEGDGNGRSLRVIRPDGSGDRIVFHYIDGNAPGIEFIHGMQWVPGEVDRIVYCAPSNGSVYSISTQDAAPFPRQVVSNLFWQGGVALSPDLEPETAGYQGALAFVSSPRDEQGNPLLGGPWLLSAVLVEDGPEGLAVDLSTLTSATTLTDRPATPSWSHDGSEIAFLYSNPSYPSAGNRLCVIPVLVGATDITFFENDVRTVYDAAAGAGLYGTDHAVLHRPTWSPDDSQIAFSATVGIEPGGGRSYDLFWAYSDGSGATNVTLGARRPKFVDWSPAWDPAAE